MPPNRKAVRITPDERDFLQVIHRQTGIPDGQFPQRPAEWRDLTATWNEATGRNDTPEDLLHYIMTQRKQGLWFRFDGTHKPLRCPPPDLFTEEQWAIVHELYIEMKTGADRILVDRDVRKELLARFFKRTGTHVPELLFMAAVIARRKSGFLPKTGTGGPDPDTGLGFSDIDEVA